MTVLYSFNIFSDKIWGPMGSLVRDASGNLYGVGFNGIYEVMASGGEKAFYLDTAGVHLNATITIDSAGNFYGTNQRGGTYGVGAVYKISPQGVETDLYSTPDVALGDGVIFDHAGNMYGTTWHGGTNGTGSIYKLTKSTE
jgi:uncharacterized repeat protein (TIGR03803 family)